MSAESARTARNAAANFAGRACTIVLGVAVVPIYIRTLGMEGYGLIGIFATFQSVFALFDFGLGTTLNRQLALHAGVDGRAAFVRDLTRSLELVYWTAAIVLGLACVAASPALAAHWINVRALDPSDVRLSLALMGAAAALQLPFALYGGGLLGLHRQVLYNGLLIGMSVLRSVGAILVLRFVSPSVVGFFVWQAVVSAMQSALAALLLWRSLPSHDARARFATRHLADVWRFAAGTGTMAVFGVVLSQVDKVLLGRLLPLAEFGVYTLAGTLGSSVYLFSQPVYMAYFPRLSAVATANDGVALARLYHEAAQFVSSILIPAAAVAACFAGPVLLLWTRDAHVAASSSAVASVLVVSFTLMALHGLPYTLLMAAARVRIVLAVSASQVLLGAPLIFVATRRFGAIGAASAWVAITGVGMMATAAAVHRRILVGEGARWLLTDVGRPLAASAAVALPARLLMPNTPDRLSILIYVLLVSVSALAAAVLATPLPRRTALGVLRRAVRPAEADVAAGAPGR